MSDKSFKVIGKAFWTKILGAPAPQYNSESRSWTIDVALDKEAVAFMGSIGLDWAVRNKQDERGNYYIFERLELKKKTNAPNKPIQVVDIDGKPWDKNVLIGNNSVVEVEFRTFTVAKFKNYPEHQRDAVLKVRVLTHVPYTPAPSDTMKVPGAHSWKGDVV
jgi:hypothetical protein